MPKCKAITNAGKPCRSRASADGFCGGHSPEARKKITGRRPRPLPVPLADLIKRYENGETAKEIADEIGWVEETLVHRLKRAGVQMRRRGARFEHSSNRYSWLSTDQIVAMWDQGLSWQEITRQLGISRATMYKRLHEVIGSPEEWRLRKQEQEAALGDRVKATPARSIDAPLTEDGFTILDTLADQDDVLSEMGQAT